MFLNCVTPELASAFRSAIHNHPLGRDAPRCEKVHCAPAVIQWPQNPTGVSGRNFALVREGTLWRAVQP